MDEALDPFRITDKLEDVLLDVMVSRLEVRGNHWFRLARYGTASG